MTAQPARAPVSEPFLAELRALIGDRLSTAAAVRDHHASDSVVPRDARRQACVSV